MAIRSALTQTERFCQRVSAVTKQVPQRRWMNSADAEGEPRYVHGPGGSPSGPLPLRRTPKVGEEVGTAWQTSRVQSGGGRRGLH